VSTPVMTKRTAQASARLKARISRVFYLLTFLRSVEEETTILLSRSSHGHTGN